MKIKELIAKLQQLDQEKNIWVFYDQYTFLEPNIIKEATESECWDGHNKDKLGDYYLDAW